MTISPDRPTKFWYRVEVSYEGAVVSCAQVCTREFGSRYIYFVTAVSPELAVAKVQKKWAGLDKLRERIRGDRRKADECINCGKPKPPERIARTLCLPCQDRTVANRLERKAIAGDSEAMATREKQVAASRKASMLMRERNAHEAQRRISDELWDSGKKIVKGTDRSVMRQVLRAYDRDPSSFRSWCLQMLGENQEAQAAE